LPSITGGVANLGIVTGFAFSGGKTTVPFAAGTEEAVDVALGVAAGEDAGCKEEGVGVAVAVELGVADDTPGAVLVGVPVDWATAVSEKTNSKVRQREIFITTTSALHLNRSADLQTILIIEKVPCQCSLRIAQL
jgi:hypothetical protein